MRIIGGECIKPAVGRPDHCPHILVVIELEQALVQDMFRYYDGTEAGARKDLVRILSHLQAAGPAITAEA